MNAKGNHLNFKGKNAERVVQELAQKSFLTDWCYSNPKLPNNKELCDLLVVFDDIAIIWQIKDLKLNEDGYYGKSEVEKNIRQLSGARRQLFDLKIPIQLENPRRRKELFDPTKIKKIFLISVLFGDLEESYSFMRDFKKLTMHVFSKDFTKIVLNELDTISDFTDYLRDKERLLSRLEQINIIGGEEELLGYYLLNDRSFTKLEKFTDLFLQDGIWEGCYNRPEYKSKKKEDEISYHWDELINIAHECGDLQSEKIARELARPNRFKRRFLAKVFYTAKVSAHKGELPIFRRIFADDGVTYVFLFQDEREPREHRINRLKGLCFAAKGLYKESSKIIGIATEKTIIERDSFDFCVWEPPEWTETDQKNFEEFQKKTGIFVNPKMNYVQEDEYPDLAIS